MNTKNRAKLEHSPNGVGRHQLSSLTLTADLEQSVQTTLSLKPDREHKRIPKFEQPVILRIPSIIRGWQTDGVPGQTQ